MQGWYIVTYALGIYQLNLFIAFLTPKIDPALEELGESDIGVFLFIIYSTLVSNFANETLKQLNPQKLVMSFQLLDFTSLKQL